MQRRTKRVVLFWVNLPMVRLAILPVSIICHRNVPKNVRLDIHGTQNWPKFPIYVKFTGGARVVKFWRESRWLFLLFLRPRPHVSGYFRIRNFFFPDTATVHTYRANSTANPEKNKSSLQWKKIYRQRIRWRVDGRIWIFFIRWRKKRVQSLSLRNQFGGTTWRVASYADSGVSICMYFQIFFRGWNATDGPSVLGANDSIVWCWCDI